MVHPDTMSQGVQTLQVRQKAFQEQNTQNTIPSKEETPQKMKHKKICNSSTRISSFYLFNFLQKELWNFLINVLQ